MPRAPRPRPSLTLSEPDRIRAYVHPVRISILRLLAAEPRTITGVARELSVHPANLTHHFRRLLGARLIRLVATRDTGRNLEKYYGATARRLVVSTRSRRTASRPALALSVVRENLDAAIEGDGPAEALALLRTARLRPADWKRFAERLRTLVQAFGRADSPSGRSCTLGVALYTEPAPGLPPSGTRVVIR
jgi:DNA-binding transcriptional ArsR family regulator